MKFKLTKASDWDYEDMIEIRSIEELIEFAKKENRSLIIYPSDKNNMPEITIYDDYIE